jgi:hypothetical protein
MNRFHDWPTRLIAVVESRRDVPFRWGTHDCCTFAADCILAMTGIDLAEGVRGSYASANQARRLLGPGGLESLPTRVLGDPLANPALAGRGDIVLLPVTERRPVLAVVIDTRAAAPGPQGLAFLPARAAARAWRV